MPPRTRKPPAKPVIRPTPQITDKELDARLKESVPSRRVIDPGYDGHMMRVAGRPWVEIAKKIGSPSPEEAQRTVSAYLQRAARSQSASHMQEALQTQADRYEVILQSWWVPATRGRDEKAAMVVLRAMERLDRLFRLDSGDVMIAKETLVVAADPESYVRQLQELVADRENGGRSAGLSG